MYSNPPQITTSNEKPASLDLPVAVEPVRAEMREHQEPPFGIVDRVTISREAREKSRQFLLGHEILESPSVGRRLMLPFSPEK